MDELTTQINGWDYVTDEKDNGLLHTGLPFYMFIVKQLYVSYVLHIICMQLYTIHQLMHTKYDALVSCTVTSVKQTC